MEDLTQEQVDEMVAEFKHDVLSKVPDGRSLQMAMMLDKGLRDEVVNYELEVMPALNANGLKAPSSKDLFEIEGFSVKVRG